MDFRVEFFFLIVHFERWQREGKTERDRQTYHTHIHIHRDFFCLLIDSHNAAIARGGPGWSQGVRKSIFLSHMVTWLQTPELSSATSQLQSRKVDGKWKSQTSVHTHWHGMQAFQNLWRNSLYHSACPCAGLFNKYYFDFWSNTVVRAWKCKSSVRIRQWRGDVYEPVRSVVFSGEHAWCRFWKHITYSVLIYRQFSSTG